MKMRINHPIIPTYAYFNEITDWGKRRYQIRLHIAYNGKRQFRFNEREQAIEFLHKLGFEYE